MPETSTLSYPYEKPQRIDSFLAKELPDLSRSRIQALIKTGDITVNSNKVKPKQALELGDKIEVTIPDPEPYEVQAEDLPLEVLHEDSDLVVINKASGMVVHPASGSPNGTVVNALRLANIIFVLLNALYLRLEIQFLPILGATQSTVKKWQF